MGSSLGYSGCNLVSDLQGFGPAHLGHQQGELLQPVVKVVAVGQTGLHRGGAVSPAHQQPHRVVGHWCKNKKHHRHQTSLTLSVYFYQLGDHKVLTFMTRPVVRLSLQNSVKQQKHAS